MSTRVEWYGLGPYSGRPTLRTAGQHWNPDTDDEPHALADEDTVPTEVALTFAGDEVGVLAGTAAELRTWLTQAQDELDRYDHAQAEARAQQPCKIRRPGGPGGTFDVRGDGSHEWQLQEDGYLRWWGTSVTVDEHGVVTAVAAAWHGSESFSETGDGDERLVCNWCQAELPIPAEVDIEFV